MKGKKEKHPIHKMGKYCGYQENKDGSIIIAPSHSDKWEPIQYRKTAIDELLKSITKHCVKLGESISRDEHDFWKSVKEDYGLDYEKYIYSYNPTTETISRKLINKEKII